MSALDSMLKDLLMKDPELLKKLQKAVGTVTEEKEKVKQPRKFSRPAPDYRLIILSGCETCQTVSEVSYEMIWDDEKRLFKPKLLGVRNKKAFVETKRQIVTTLTCAHCFSSLSLQDPETLASLIVLMQDPIKTEARIQVFKRFLKQRELQAVADKE